MNYENSTIGKKRGKIKQKKNNSIFVNAPMEIDIGLYLRERLPWIEQRLNSKSNLINL